FSAFSLILLMRVPGQDKGMPHFNDFSFAH
ncbi:MAG: hypothetical protein ACI9LO_003277, partial [Planctomycetota bacterium]